MISTGGKWLRPSLTALVAVLAFAGRSWSLAQGFGPDPFRPYNPQYDAYTYPMGPASPAGGQGGMVPRMGNAGANQFQGYLDEMAARPGG